MNFSDAKSEMKQLLGRVDPSELPKLINWIQGSGEPPGTTGPKTSSLVTLVKVDVLPVTPAVIHQYSSAAMNWSDYRLGRYPDFRKMLGFAILLTGR